MKKNNTKKSTPSKKVEKESGELRKPVKLKPLKEKEKKNWKNNLEEDEDFDLDNDIKFEDNLEEGEEDFFDDDF